jgi:hypothetical protein
MRFLLGQLEIQSWNFDFIVERGEFCFENLHMPIKSY